MAPPLLDEDGSGLDIGVGVGEAGRDISREEQGKSAAPCRVVPNDGLGPLRGNDEDGSYTELVRVCGSGSVGPSADYSGSREGP